MVAQLTPDPPKRPSSVSRPVKAWSDARAVEKLLAQVNRTTPQSFPTKEAKWTRAMTTS